MSLKGHCCQETLLHPYLGRRTAGMEYVTLLFVAPEASLPIPVLHNFAKKALATMIEYLLLFSGFGGHFFAASTWELDNSIGMLVLGRVRRRLMASSVD